MSGIPWPSSMFPHSVEWFPPVVAQDAVGGAILTPGTGVTMSANVQPARAEAPRMMAGDEANAVSGENHYTVATLSNPGVLPLAQMVWALTGQTMIVKAVPRFAQRLGIWHTELVERV